MERIRIQAPIWDPQPRLDQSDEDAMTEEVEKAEEF